MILHPSLKSHFITKENRTFSATLVFFSSLSLSCNQSSQIVPWASLLMGSPQHPTCPQQHHHSTPVHSLISLPNPSNSSSWRQDPATPSVKPCMPSWGYLVHTLDVSSPQLSLLSMAPAGVSGDWEHPVQTALEDWPSVGCLWAGNDSILPTFFSVQLSSLLQLFTKSMEM